MLHNKKVSLGRILLVKIHDNWTAHLRFKGVHSGNWYAIPLQLSSNLKYIEQAFIWAHKWAITTIFLWVISIYFFSINMDTLLFNKYPCDLILRGFTVPNCCDLLWISGSQGIYEILVVFEFTYITLCVIGNRIC